MEERLNILLGKLKDASIDEELRDSLMLELQEIIKQNSIDSFLLNRYKQDYSNTVFFLNRSVEEVEEKNNELIKSNSDLERFAFSVAHDLKSPLRNISNFVDLMSMRIKDEDFASIPEYLDFVKSNTKKLLNVVDETLEVAKLNTDSLYKDKVDLNRVLNAVTNDVRGAYRHKNITISFPFLPTIDANKTLLYKLFLNLVENGIKYNTSENPTIKVNADKVSNGHQFVFEDNGIGIEEADQERIFDLYSRLHGDNRYEGTGIGLAMCKKIVESYNGSIAIESVVGEGTKFSVTISEKGNAIKISNV